MTFDRYAQWLSRGRAHQAARRPIDALLCYRRALREAPQGVDAHFHVGEIAWHLGNDADAIAAWRIASARSPRHLPSWHALADALAANGEFDASRDAATHVLALRPAESRATALRVLLDATRGGVPDGTLAAAVRASRSWPLTLLAGVLVRAVAGAAACDAAQSLPALVEASLEAIVTRGNEDALRRIAVALADAGFASEAQRFADRYGEACRSLHRAAMPLLWPLRTAGDALRVGLLIAPGNDSEAAAFRALLAAAGLGGDVHCTTLVGPDATPVALAARRTVGMDSLTSRATTAPNARLAMTPTTSARHPRPLAAKL